jgi:hypothetical protein
MKRWGPFSPCLTVSRRRRNGQEPSCACAPPRQPRQGPPRVRAGAGRPKGPRAEGAPQMPMTRPAGWHAEPLAEGTRRGHPHTSPACTSAHGVLTGEIRKVPTVHNRGGAPVALIDMFPCMCRQTRGIGDMSPRRIGVSPKHATERRSRSPHRCAPRGATANRLQWKRRPATGT